MCWWKPYDGKAGGAGGWLALLPERKLSSHPITSRKKKSLATHAFMLVACKTK
jgi:hypothetical protein